MIDTTTTANLFGGPVRLMTTPEDRAAWLVANLRPEGIALGTSVQEAIAAEIREAEKRGEERGAERERDRCAGIAAEYHQEAAERIYGHPAPDLLPRTGANA
jgi:hypothetical protein